MTQPPSGEKIYLNVPFLQKEIVKKLGAHFDFNKKSWYIDDHQDPTPFTTWLHPEHKPATANYPTATNPNLSTPSASLCSKDNLLDPPQPNSATAPSTHSDRNLPPAISLLYLTQLIKQTMQQHYQHPLWIQAEIAHIKSHRQHHYLELVQRADEGGEELAKIRATLWKSQQPIIDQFEQQTGNAFTTNLKVMLQVRCDFHERFGLSLNILNINADYTLGQMQRKINAIRKSLQHKGIYHQNKEKTLPTILHKIAVISPENAAGLADFNYYLEPLIEHKLCQCDYYHALFQGDQASQSIDDCIHQILDKQPQKNYQLIVIIRGGGSITDLQCLEEYAINESVCLSPIPVWVGLGHQEDKLLINEVAHCHFPTPTALAKHIVDHLLAPLKHSIHQWQQIQLFSKQRLNQESEKIAKQHLKLNQYCHQITQQSHNNLTTKRTALHIHSHARIKNTYATLAHRQQTLQQATQDSLRYHKYTLTQLRTNLKTLSAACIGNYHTTLKTMHDLIDSSHPQKILKRGFAIIRHRSNQPLTQLADIQQQHSVRIQMHTGSIDATIHPQSTTLTSLPKQNKQHNREDKRK